MKRYPVLATGLLLFAASAMSLNGCQPEQDRAAPAAAARVDGSVIPQDQVEVLAARLSGTDAGTARRAVLERLVGEEVLRAEALRQGLHKDPKVRARLAAAEREVLATAYLDDVAARAAKPGAAEIHDYYQQHPELFAERRIYALREIDIEGGADVAQAVEERAAKAKSVAELLEWLRTTRVAFSVKDITLAAESLPMNWVAALHALRDGQMALVRGERGLVMLGIAGSRSEPVSEQTAAPRIEQFLWQQRRTELMRKTGADLRARAAIEYLPPYAAESPAAAAAGPARP
ncbi:MAG: EpsD family peptidyl-prolyl cis-trans isomerase [Rhodocyclaceae bacterium]|nr:EpsD family peptidyl-prolyl cis-trans isomerase [Rhodocyclaceae bacterium]